MSYPKPHGKKETNSNTRQMTHAKILRGSLHNSQFEAHEVATSKTKYKSVSEAYEAGTNKPKRKQSSTNSCTEPQGTKSVKPLGKTASNHGNRVAENPNVHNTMNGIILHSTGLDPVCDGYMYVLELVKGEGILM